MPKSARPPPNPRPPRVAISFFSFDRHRLARLTLGRVLRFKPADWTLRVWQDGAQARHSGRVVGDAGRIRRNLEMFEQLGLDVEYEPDVNNGTALNFWAAERWTFETMQADIGIFLEDDIVISRHFFSAMASLARLALNHPRVGAFSAFGDASIDWRAQWLARRRLQPMHHRWGCGITRDYWLRSRVDYQIYLDLLAGCDYRERPAAAISDWLNGLDHASPISHITSQDGVRTAIMLKLGCFSIMTTPSYAVNIGKQGMHSFPEFYLARRSQIRGRHGFFPMAVTLPATLDEADAEMLAAASRRLEYW